MEPKQAYLDKMRAELREADAKIEQLRAKADKAEAETRIEAYKQIDLIKTKRQELDARIDAVKQASGEAWDDLKEGAEKARGTLEDALKNAASRFM